MRLSDNCPLMLERTLESPRVDGEVGRQVAVGKGVAESGFLARGGKTVGEKVSGCIVASFVSDPLLTAGQQLRPEDWRAVVLELDHGNG